MTDEDRVALEMLNDAIMKIDDELSLDAVAAENRIVVRALIRTRLQSQLTDGRMQGR